jgi:hypothetical protein
MTLIAQCIATAGYGTTSYDPETSECSHECYACVDTVILNKEYWAQYDNMSSVLNDEFDLGFNFNRYRLSVFADGTKKAEHEPWGTKEKDTK